MLNKICNVCRDEKDLSLFPKTGGVCKVCRAKKLREFRASDKKQKEKRQNYRNKNIEKIRKQGRDSYLRNIEVVKCKNNDYYHSNIEKCRDRQRKYQERIETVDIESWLAKCMKHCKSADKRLGRDFDLDLDFLIDLFGKQNQRCALSNVLMLHERKNLFSASIDRINPKIGHIKSNVQLVCQTINLAKREFNDFHLLDFLFDLVDDIGHDDIFGFEGYDFPESTSTYSQLRKYKVIKKMRNLFTSKFIPPTYGGHVEDLDRIDGHKLDDYLIDGQWRSHRPDNKLFAGRKIIFDYHKHIWNIRVSGKPLISEEWNGGKILEKVLINLVNGSTRISLNRIIREFIFAGCCLPSQIHPGFAKAVLTHFGAKSGDVFYDPFAGWGGRMLAARSLGLDYVACELSRPTYDGLIAMSSDFKYDCVIKNVSCLNYMSEADIMFTSPPFGTEEYIGSDSFVDLDLLLEKTKHIPIRILHLNKRLSEQIQYKNRIKINTKIRASAESSCEYLVVI